MEKQQKSTVPFSIKLCDDRAAFEVRLLRNAFLKMDYAKQLLENAKGHEVVVWTPYIMILRYGGAEVTLSKDGRMLIKRVENEKQAAYVAQNVLSILFQNETH